MKVLEPKERYYSVREVASLLGVSRGRVHQFVCEGRLEPSRIGNVLVFGQKELDRFRKIPRLPGRPKSIA